MRVIPFHHTHLQLLNTVLEHKPFAETYGEWIDRLPGWTTIDGGRYISSVGIIPFWPGRNTAWFFFNRDTTLREYAWIAKRCVMVLDNLQSLPRFRRIEATVDAEEPSYRRWAERLGFQCETPEPMKAYATDGRDYYLYARVR